MTDVIKIDPEHMEPSLLKWSFHIETIKLWQKNIPVSPENTPYFSGVVEYKKKGGGCWAECLRNGEIDKKAILVRIRKFKKLWQDISASGYDHNQPIDIAITKTGAIVIKDGHHRASIMYMLGLPISAKIIARAPEWDALSRAARRMYGSDSRKLYHPIDHIEFQDWKIARDLHHRATAIELLEANWAGLSVLDIGANQGGISFHMADKGASATAAEQSPVYYNIGENVDKTLRKYQKKTPVTWFRGDGWDAAKSQRWDWILCLSVMHHFMKRPDGYEYVKQQLNALLQQADRGVVVEFGTKMETQMRNTDIPATQEALGEWLNIMTPGHTWEPIMKGVPKKDQKSGSDYRWLWATKKQN